MTAPRPDPTGTPPPHPHFTLATVAVVGLVVAVVAAALGIGALAVTASRNSVDDALVAGKVDALLAGSEPVEIAVAPGGDVLPVLTPKAELPVADEDNVAVAPAVPEPSGRTSQAIVDVTLEIVEGLSTVDPATGAETETWGYRLVDEDNALVAGTPGPVIRARVGDVLRLTLTNPATSTHPHNIDLHAVTGQGGGAADTVVAPGESKTIEARLLYPGFFMYHCAYDDVPAHISHGMHGGILVDPETPLPPVDHEWYVVQSEYYTTGDEGTVDFDRAAVTDENPSFVVFNGAVGALTGDNALRMNVGERARIYFVNAGLNLDSNFHPIGSHWDRVYPEAALLNSPLRGSQTTLVPAGGGTVVELVAQVPSTIVLVDHALSRAFDKGAIGQIVVSGAENPEIFQPLSGPSVAAAGDTMHGPAPAGGETVSIVAGAGNPQPMDSPDELDEGESPADYSVNVLRVPVGTTVTWRNDDAMMHTVTAVDGTFDSGFLAEGDTWSFTFDEPGEHEYYCLPHPWMRARVVVEG